MEKGNLLWYIKDAIKWRKEHLVLGFLVLTFAPRDVSFGKRFRFFFAKLRLLLPIPNRYMERYAEMFALGFSLVSENYEEIYEREGLLYVVPKGKLSGVSNLIATIELLSQYREPPVIVEEGDVVLDCGAFIGITSLLFSKLAGKSGKVIAIEPEENNYATLQKIAKLNEGNSATIIPLKVAVYRENCELELYISDNPIFSSCHTLYRDIEHKTIRESLIGLTEKVKAVKIDTLVEELGLERVDFIKMDIEGAEIDALLGAERTISQFKPKLAICTYHRPTDSIEIKKILSKYNPNYKFKEIERGEKVLFAWDEMERV